MAAWDGKRIRTSIASDDAAKIADTLGITYAQIEAALTPVIGSLGVAALCKRSVYLAGQTHPWLLGSHENLQAPMDLAALKSAIAGQDNVEAAAGAALLLQTFNEVLTRLVGASLTERLLSSVWSHLSSSAPAQDSSS